jgi:uncharacterized membrane protein YgcG
MRNGAKKMKNLRLAAGVGATMLLAVFLVAQQPPPDAQPPDAPPPPGAPPPPAQQAPLLAPQQLQALVAPIALYPDNLLSQILVASTYPLEVVEAQQWLQQNRSLAGQNLVNAAQRQNWDPSIQALVVFPEVLTRLNQDIRWTTDLGNAFLAQQADLMAAVQALRASAQANGKLKSGPDENVTTATQNGQSAIQIAPPDPGTVYVPNYNPAWVWGPPPYGYYYPPLLYPGIDVGFGFFPGIDLGFYFGGGWGLWGGFGWGWGPNWFGGGIFLNAGFFHRFGFRDFHPGFGGSNVWVHDPGHRLGVAYPNRAVASRFGGAAGFRGNAAIRGGAEGFRSGETRTERAPSGQRFGSQGFERQNPGGNRSAFSGIRSGGETQMRSDHGFSSMGHSGFGGFGGGGGFHGGGGHGGGRR